MNPILIDPEILNGEPCFAGTRVPVAALFDYLEDGSIAAFLDDFPSVTMDQALAVLAIVKAVLPQLAERDPLGDMTQEERAALHERLRVSIAQAAMGFVITMEDSLADLDVEEEPDTIVPHQGGIVAALRRSPLVGANVLSRRGANERPVVKS